MPIKYAAGLEIGCPGGAYLKLSPLNPQPEPNVTDWLCRHVNQFTKTEKSRRLTRAGYFASRYFLAALRLAGVSGVRFFPRSQTGAGKNVGYRNPKERVRASTLYCGDNDDARNRPRSNIFRTRATWPCGVLVQMPR